MNKNRFYDWVAGILSAAVISLFGLVLNANTYFNKVDDNTNSIKHNSLEIKEVKEYNYTEIEKIKETFRKDFKLMRKEATKNKIEVLSGINELKIELQNKKNRD